MESKRKTNGEENRDGKKWKIRVKDLEKQSVSEEIFDAVMICNGHYFEPSIPKIKGDENFLGQKIHSHDYRVPDIFKEKSVLVIGAGPSGKIIHKINERRFYSKLKIIFLK